MELFGVGPLEFLLVLVLALVILGPQDMVGTARRIGQWIYRVVRSPTWRAIISTTQDLRELPQKIVREAGIEEAMQEVKSTAAQVKDELSATTNEISSEMRAASSSVSSEMNAAVGTLQQEAAGMAPLPVAYSENNAWPENILAQRTSDEPPSVSEIIRTSATPYETQLGFFAESLLMGAKPVIDLGQITPPAEPPPPVLQAPDDFANALGSFSGLFASTPGLAAYETGPVFVPAEAPPEQEETEPAASVVAAGPAGLILQPSQPLEENPPTENAPAAEWAQGIPTGLSGGDGVTISMEEHLRLLSEKIDRLEAKTTDEVSKDTDPTI